MHRRRFLTATAAAGALLAGCQGGPGDAGSGGSDGSDGTGGDTNGSGGSGASGGSGGSGSDGGTGGSWTLPDHGALNDLATQPRLGPEPGSARGLIVAFEDPSCTRCAAFERDVVPQIEANLVEPGTASFVFRGYPVIYPWGEPATHALEAVYEADEAAFWDLKDHYYGNQGDFGGTDAAGVYDMTESFLSSETDLDATAVVDRARDGEVDAAVQTDLDAGDAAGAGRITPVVFLFADGEFRTRANGSVSYSVIESAMGI